MTRTFDVGQIRKDFPMLSVTMNGHPLAYLDNAATAQKPAVVIDRMTHFYRNEYANVHRGVYTLSQQATDLCEAVRGKCRDLIGADSASEIVFTRGATEAINLVAASFGRGRLKAGDEIIVTEIEHHSNLVPWQDLCEQKGLKLRVIPVNDRGELDLDAFDKLLNTRTYLVCVTHVSNALGTVNPVEEIVKRAHHAGAAVLVDGAQSVPHMKVNVKEMGCDFFCFSGHKLYGPTGIGVLYAKKERLTVMAPYQFGGDMVRSVTLEKTLYADAPARFEAGTPAIAEIVGLGAAIDYLERIGWDVIASYEHELLVEATSELGQVKGLTIIGSADEKASLISFVLEGAHPHDIGTVLDQLGIAIRAGHHCAQPTMKRFGIPATVRASLAFYNTHEEIGRLVSGVREAGRLLR